MSVCVGQASREADTLRRRAESLVPREELLAAADRVRELEAELAAQQSARADTAPAAALAVAQEEARRLRETCGRLEDAARRAAAAEGAAAAAKEEALQEVRRLRGCLDGSVPRAKAEAVEAQLEGLASEVAWLRRLVASMAQVHCRFHFSLRGERKPRLARRYSAVFMFSDCYNNWQKNLCCSRELGVDVVSVCVSQCVCFCYV